MNTETKHTPGQLTVRPSFHNQIWFKETQRIAADCCGDNALANACRLVHCWNTHDDMAKEIAQLKADKAELVAALKTCQMRPCGYMGQDQCMTFNSSMVEAAIAKHSK